MSKLVIVCGGREYDDYDAVLEAVESERPTFLIEGEAPGADLLARQVAYDLMIPHIGVPALWGPQGQPRIRKAGYDRNLLMMKVLLKLGEGHEKKVIAMPGNKGTKMMTDIAERFGVPVERYG